MFGPGGSRIQWRPGRQTTPDPMEQRGAMAQAMKRWSSAPTRSSRPRRNSSRQRSRSSAPARPSASTPTPRACTSSARIAAARPQERMQLRRMADVSMALAERRAGPQGGRRAARAGGPVGPSDVCPAGHGPARSAWPGSCARCGDVADHRGPGGRTLLALGPGIVELISLPFGGLGLAPGAPLWACSS